uniref:Kinesin associated protein 3 n=1 Tax=Molossus molossus TaxID=27622 RepID=A0A7J8CR97_MOLMO|nr:kinesin associated protein 3 [Molossus molossus]
MDSLDHSGHLMTSQRQSQGKLKEEILMYIHQKKHSLFNMKWKLPFLEKWGIPCWENEKNAKKSFV